MYSNIEDAIYFMVKANKGLKIKYDNVDKSFHNFCVYNTMKEITNIEDILVSSLLFDIIDNTDYGYEEIEEKFGTLVADIVLELSEDMSITKWFARKKDYVKRMQNNNDINIINLMIADKLHILLSYYNAYKKYGNKFWKNTGGTRDENCYFFREIYNIGKRKNANETLMERYKNIVIMYFGEIDEQ